MDGAQTLQPPAIIIQGSGVVQPKKGAAARAAAKRLLRLKHRTENWSEFARRIGVSPQHIDNYKKKGISLDVLAGLRLTTADLLYVLRAGDDTEPPVSLERPSDQALEELRDWIDRVLPTSPSANGRPSEAEMASELMARGWLVVPPGQQPDAGGGGGP